VSLDVVVTGASGFLGRALERQLRDAAFSMTGVTRGTSPGLVTVQNYADTPHRPGAVLVHLAQGRDTSASFDDIDVLLCRTLAGRGWRHIVYASSAAVYGDTADQPHRPEDHASAYNDYTRVKLACEEIVAGAGGTCLRFANIYGPGMGSATVISDILCQIPGTGALTVRDVSPVRDFLWIEDAARCLAAACRIMPGEILNVGSGYSIAVGEVARVALDLAGEGSRAVIGRNRSSRRSCLKLDISKTRALLKWSPDVDIRTGLRTLLHGRPHGN